MLDELKPEDLLQGTITDSGVGLLCCTDFQLSARIPLPTRYAGHPPPGGGNFTAPLGRRAILESPLQFNNEKTALPGTRQGCRD